MDYCGIIDPSLVSFAPGLPSNLPTLLPAFRPLCDWLKRFPSTWNLSALEIQSADMFGPRIGFLKIKATIHNTETGKPVPGIVFLRGGAVGVLLVLKRRSDGEKFVVITTQARAPVAHSWLREIPAGMLDGDHGFAGVAAKEIEEECGIKLTKDDLFDLTGAVYGDNEGMYPSAGGCDEFIRLFYHERTVDDAEIERLQGSEHGVETEAIKLEVLPIDQLIPTCQDAKALSAMALYEYCKIKGMLPAQNE